MKHTQAAPAGVHMVRHGRTDQKSYELAEATFRSASIPLLDKLEAFPRFATKRSIARFMVKERIYEKFCRSMELSLNVGSLTVPAYLLGLSLAIFMSR